MLRLLLPQRISIDRYRLLHTSLVSLVEHSLGSGDVTPAKWTPSSIRTGVIARKRGMTTLWDEHGAAYPVTILQVCIASLLCSSLLCSSYLCSFFQLENCQVTANVRTVRKDSSIYHAVQIAATDRPWKTTTRQMRGHFTKAGVSPKLIVKEFPVTEDALIPIGKNFTIPVPFYGS